MTCFCIAISLGFSTAGSIESPPPGGPTWSALTQDVAGVGGDAERALIWDQCSGETEAKIGELYWEGSAGVQRDPAEAVRHFRVAAERGVAIGARKLAIAYSSGEGVPADDAQMVKWDRKAAEAGDAMAEAMLGYAIMIGIDGTYDLVEAATWLTLASENFASGDRRRQAAAYADDALSKLTAGEHEAFHARLARWRSTLGGTE